MADDVRFGKMTLKTDNEKTTNYPKGVMNQHLNDLWNSITKVWYNMDETLEQEDKHTKSPETIAHKWET